MSDMSDASDLVRYPFIKPPRFAHRPYVFRKHLFGKTALSVYNDMVAVEELSALPSKAISNLA